MATKNAQHPRVKVTFHDPAELRRRRRLAGLSQAALAKKVGITPPHVCYLEAGKSEASPPVLLRIAEALACTTEDLERRQRDGANVDTKRVPA